MKYINQLDPASGEPMLYKCARSGFYDLTKELISLDGVDVNIQQRSANSTALHAACFYGHMPVVELLLSKKADVNRAVFKKPIRF